ncbi:MAG: molybdopterin-guanine dinucleotide biosynthesis protein B [Thermoprotei archaeon]
MHILAITGRKNSGKTTLIEEIVKRFSHTTKIAVIKHIHHEGTEFDVKGTDTWRAKRAGASIVIGLAPDTLFVNAKMSKQNLELALNIIKTMDQEIKLILLEGFYSKIKGQINVKRIIVIRSIEEIRELLNDENKPLAIFCLNCDNKEINGIPVYNNINDILLKIEELIKDVE